MGMNQTDILNQQEDTQKNRFLTFVLGEEIYGLKIEYIKEIIGMQPITRLPEVPEYIKGIINLRSKIIPVIDMRLKFKKQPIPYNERTCIIVVVIQEMMVGLIVDTVLEVPTIMEENIVPPPENDANIQNNYLFGIGMVGDEVKLLLDCERLLREDEAESMREIN